MRTSRTGTRAAAAASPPTGAGAWTTAGRLGTVALAVALVVAPLAGVASAHTERTAATVPAAVRAADASPVGPWKLKATGDDGNVIETVTTFHADGTAGNNKGGTGTWTATGRGTFSYQITELIHEGGQLVLRIEIEQEAALACGGFTSEGTARSYDASGAFLGTTLVTAVGTRA